MQWTTERARQWNENQPWRCGFNYVPSVAVNSTEMWQAGTFDAPTIARELGWAQDIGLNSCRVFLPFLVWEHDPDGFVRRFDEFLAVADRHGMTTLPVLFDDCAFAGKQPILGRRTARFPASTTADGRPRPARFALRTKPPGRRWKST